jgi:hypothetical protein
MDGDALRGEGPHDRLETVSLGAEWYAQGASELLRSVHGKPPGMAISFSIGGTRATVREGNTYDETIAATSLDPYAQVVTAVD